MRSRGRVNSAAGHMPTGHLCWAFTGRSDFQTRAVQYLRDGLAVGQWLEYVGTGPAATLHAELAERDGLGPVLEAGGIAVTPVDEFYAFQPGSTVVDPHAAVTARIAATEQALAAGYTGFRAVVDATTLVATPRQRAAFVQFELLIDHTMSTLPVTALCGFDLDTLGHTAAAELACLHPLTNLHLPFQLFAEHDGTLAVSGTIDHRCAELFIHALGHAAALTPRQQLVLDAQHLTSIEASQLQILDRLARDHDRTVILSRAPLATTRLIQQLDLTHILSENPEHT